MQLAVPHLPIVDLLEISLEGQFQGAGTGRFFCQLGVHTYYFHEMRYVQAIMSWLVECAHVE
jgi:hypothetical protein